MKLHLLFAAAVLAAGCAAPLDEAPAALARCSAVCAPAAVTVFKWDDFGAAWWCHCADQTRLYWPGGRLSAAPAAEGGAP